MNEKKPIFVFIKRITMCTRIRGLLFLFAIFFIGCTDVEQKADEKEGVETVLPSKTNEVSTIILKRQPFHHELVSNGRVCAREYADLYFRTQELIAHIWVKNGSFVHKGQKLAELELFKLKNTLEQRQNILKQSDLEMQDVLIGQGYSLENQASIPEEIMKLARVKSGYEQSKAQLSDTEYELQQATLVAPYDGLVANLFAKEHNMASPTKAFCRVINTGSMEVDFTVLESELLLLKLGDEVEVTPYASSDSSLKGNVSEINPLVDENGQVRVKARVKGGGKLFDGMNVRVRVKRAVADQLVVPKKAVVLRTGKQVVFTHKDGKAMWCYVHTGLENKDEYTVLDGLNEGDEVIVDGNVNLAHESPVSVVNS